MTLQFSPAAQDDLLEIAAFIAHDNPTRALTFVDELEQQCKRLAATPGMGTLRPELGSGLRMFPSGRYLIFYRQIKQAVRIERIVHGARDIDDDDFETGPDARR